MKKFLIVLALTLVVASVEARGADAQTIGGVDTSQWRGFNLLEKFTLRGDAPYKETDFAWIAELGFTFVRLPIDYRCYVDAKDWLKFNESALREIDQAILLGEKYGIHVCLNLHRAPGYCINPPAEARDLWTDPIAQAAFAAHWAMFARRYRDVSPERLSFNLLNEPIRNTRETYLRVHTMAIEAIHAVDPQRLVIVDGNNAGRDPFLEFLKYPNLIQATRGYHPASISHFRASWAKGSDTWPVPTWPPLLLNGHLFGPSKPELKSALVLRGDFQAGTEITLVVAQLSGSATLQARADGKAVAEKRFDPKLDPNEWRTKPSDAKWVYHEPIHEMVFRVALTQAAHEIALENIAGDWIRFSELRWKSADGAVHVWPADPTWGSKQTLHEVTRDGRLLPPAGAAPNQPLLDYIKPWKQIAAAGETVFVGEWGCYNRTPHDVALAWMKSWLEQWQQARFGWALWNFRGAFGVLDSGRADVTYEEWHGHKLDREMLTLLQSYARAQR